MIRQGSASKAVTMTFTFNDIKNADSVSNKYRPEHTMLADGYLPVCELERHSTAQAISSLSSLVRDESPPTAIKCESFSCSSSQPFTKSTVYLQQ